MSHELPTVAVVTPSYNQGAYIEATVRSVVKQDYPGIEYFVADAGSTDGTIDVLRRYESRLKWVSEPDAGQADAVNKAIARTTGQLIGWLNSDDSYAPGAIRLAGEYLRDHPEVAMVYGNADYIDKTGQFIAQAHHIEPFNAKRLLYYSDYIVQPAAFFRRSAVDAVGGLDASLHYTMDYALWLKFARAGLKIVHLPKLLAHYRWLGHNKTAVGGDQRLIEIARLMREMGGKGLPAYVRLEQVRQDAIEAIDLVKQGRVIRSASRLCHAVGRIISSTRVLKSLTEPQMWRTVSAGRALRASVDNRK